VNWRDELMDAAKPPATAGERQLRNPPKYKVGDSVQTNFSAWPNTQPTQHTVQRVWTWQEGYPGHSGYAYHLQPEVRGSRYLPLDEGWLSPTTKPHLSN
jgi:hypothetical protein